MRTKHLGLDDPTAPEAPSEPVVRVSGIPRSELLEPAALGAVLLAARSVPCVMTSANSEPQSSRGAAGNSQ